MEEDQSRFAWMGGLFLLPLVSGLTEVKGNNDERSTTAVTMCVTN